MARRIHDGIEKEQSYIHELLGEFNLKPSTPVGADDKTICFTGKSTRPRSEMHQAAREKGLVPVDTVTSATTYLVVADPSSTSSKILKAKKMGVTILSEEAFWSM
jgi:NAD-dependent DNA ligase